MRRSLSYWLYAAPALLLMALVNAVPIGETVALAGRWGVLLHDPSLKRALVNTAVFTAWTVALELAAGLALALLLARPFRGRGFVRAAALVPWALPTAVMAMAWRWIFTAESGPFAGWLASPRWSMAACVLADVWKTAPFMAVLLLAGLSSIPAELYEAAEVDGAGPVRRFFLVTLPLLRPTIALAVLFRAVQSFGVFDLVWVLTGGGPGGRTRMLALYIYDTVFRYQELSYGCALTLVMAGCLAVIAAGALAALRPERT